MDPPYWRAVRRERRSFDAVHQVAQSINADVPPRSEQIVDFCGEGLKAETLRLIGDVLPSVLHADEDGDCIPTVPSRGKDARPSHLRHRVHHCHCPTKEEMLRHALQILRLFRRGFERFTVRYVINEAGVVKKELANKTAEAESLEENIDKLTAALQDVRLHARTHAHTYVCTQMWGLVSHKDRELQHTIKQLNRARESTTKKILRRIKNHDLARAFHTWRHNVENRRILALESAAAELREVCLLLCQCSCRPLK